MARFSPLARSAALWRRLATRHRLTLGVRVALWTADGRVLLVRHTYVSGWHLPGGGVEAGESIGAAAVREVREETGLVITGTPRLLGVCLRQATGLTDHVAVLAAAPADWTGSLKPNRWEIAEADFFAPHAPPADASPATLRRLREFSQGRGPAERW
jgi:ADP-ribose pyrophosphatase YjhB (NUDIX family)